MLEFGVRPKCLNCGVQLTKDNISSLSKVRCKWCKPAPKKQTIHRYSGFSRKKKGGYEHDSE